MLLTRNLKLQTKIMILVFAVVVVALLVSNWLTSRSVEIEIQKGTGRQAISIAQLVARSPIIVEGLTGEKEISELQRYAMESADATDVQFVVILDMQGIRKAHPDPAKVGQKFVGGDEVEALAGKEYTSVAKGTLGDSLRAFVPVFTANGQQVGVVVVGILLEEIRILEKDTHMALLLAILIGMLIGIIGAYLLSQNVKKTLFGLEPEAIAKRLEERNAMLESVHEGIIAVDRQGIISLVNDEALKMLGVDDSPVGKKFEDFVPNTNLMAVMEARVAELDQDQDFQGTSVIGNCLPMIVNGEVVGAISTFRDKTEVKGLAEELTGVRSYVDALRAQAHEFMNQLHVILGLVKLKSYEQLAVYINQITSEHEEEINLVAKRIEEPILAGFVLSKLSLAREKKVVMHLAEESYVPAPCDHEIVHEMVTIIGNLVENAFDAVRSTVYKEVELYMYYDEGSLYILVSDTGEGIMPELSNTLFTKGVSSKDGNRGFGLYLVERSVKYLAGEIDFESRPGEGTVFTVKIPYKIKGNQDD